MSNEISNQNIVGLQDELLRNISSIKQKVSEWLDRPQVGGIESLCDAITEIKNILLLLGKTEVAELGDEIIAVIVALQKSVQEAGEDKPSNFDKVGAEVASGILIMDDYIEHLSDKRDNRYNILEILRVMRSIKEDITSFASYSAKPHISKDTYQSLANKVSETIENSRIQIEQYRRDPSNALNIDAITGHNKELINIFAILDLREPQFLLQKINQILEGQPSESEWIDIAEAMILIEETLQQLQIDKSSSVSTYSEALAKQIHHSRKLEVKHLLQDTGKAALQLFEALRKKVVQEESVHSGQGWQSAALQLAHYSAITELAEQSSLASTLRGMGKVYTAISLQSTVPSVTYPLVIDSLVGVEYIFTDLSQGNYPSEQDIAFLKEAIMQIASNVPVTAEAEQQFANFINTNKEESIDEREDLSGTFGTILNDSLMALDRFGAPIELEAISAEDISDESVQLSPSMVHIASIKDITPIANSSTTELGNVTIQSNIQQSSSPQESAATSNLSLPSSSTLQPENVHSVESEYTQESSLPTSDIADKSAIDTSLPIYDLPPNGATNLSGADNENVHFIPFFRNKNLADLDHLQVPTNKQNFIVAHADAVMDEEIREFFGEEFAEILELLNKSFPEWQAEPDSLNLTTDIRRAFHTLKGSGRTVGYEALGEFAWQHEQLLNRVLDNHYRANVLVQSTVGDAIDLLNILNIQDEFAEHQGALLQQAAAAEAVREGLMQDRDLGETFESFTLASQQWRLHDDNLTQKTLIPTETEVAAKEESEHPQSIDSVQYQSPLLPDDFVSSDTASDISEQEQLDLPTDLQATGMQNFDSWLQIPESDMAEPVATEQASENVDEWISPFELASQDSLQPSETGTKADSSTGTREFNHQHNEHPLTIDADATRDVLSHDNHVVNDRGDEDLFTFMDDADWRQISAEDHAAVQADSHTETTPLFDKAVLNNEAATETSIASTRVPDDLASSDIFADDGHPVSSIRVKEPSLESDPHIISKVARTLEKGLAHEGGDETVHQAVQATLQRQLSNELLSDPDRLATLAKAVQSEMANQDAAILRQVQSIFSQIQAQTDPLLPSRTESPVPIDPRAEQIVRMLEKGLANSSDNPALTAALEATLQNRLSNDVLGDSNKLDALMEEISATLAAFPTITKDTAEEDEFLASVEQITQSIELGLSLGELSISDKEALAAAIKQELLYPPASEQDSEQLKEAVENRLQEKQLLPASDIREVVQKAFTSQAVLPQTSVSTSLETQTGDISFAQQGKQNPPFMSDFSWPDTADHTVSPADALHALDKAAFATLQKTLDKALATGDIDDSVVAGISMALARQWQQNNLPVDSASFSNIANQLRGDNSYHDTQGMDDILQALAKRLGVAATLPEKAITDTPSADSQSWFNETAAQSIQDTHSNEYKQAASISTLQRTLDKALLSGAIDDSVASGIGMALAHQWQHNHLPLDAPTFTSITEQLRNNSQQYDQQDVNNILQSLANRLGMTNLSAEQPSTDNQQWAGTSVSPFELSDQDRSSLNTLQKTLDKALQSGAIDHSVIAGIGMTLARQWQQNHLPVNDEAFAYIAAQLRDSSQHHNTQDVTDILQTLAGQLGITLPASQAELSASDTITGHTDNLHNSADIYSSGNSAESSSLEGTAAESLPRDWQETFPQESTISTPAIQDWQTLPSLENRADMPATEILRESSPAVADTALEDKSSTVIQQKYLEEDSAFSTNVSAQDEAATLSAFDDTNHHESESESESAWDIESSTPVLDAPSQAVLQATQFSPVGNENSQQSIHVSLDVSPAQDTHAQPAETNSAPTTASPAGWTDSLEYVRPSISMKSSAASLRLSQELEQLAQHPTLDDAAIRPAGAAEEASTDAAVFLHAVDKFETLTHQIEDSSDPETINELIESVYDIEDSIETETAPEWTWQMLDAVEQLLLMYKYQGANVSASAASSLRQAAHLIEHHREQDNEEEALEAINSLISARQERSRISTERQDGTSSDAYGLVEAGYGDDLIEDPNANTLLAETFLDEAMTLFGRSQLDAERWDEDLSRLGILDRIRRDMHTLKGSSRMAGYMAIGDLTHAVENLIDSILDGYSKASSRAAAILSGAMWQGMLMLDNIRDGYLPQTDPYILNNISEYLNQPLPYPEVAAREKLVKEQQRQEAEEAQFRPVGTPAPAAAPAASSQAAAPQPAISHPQAPVDAAPAQETPPEVFGEGFDSDIDPVLVSIFTDEAEELLATTEHYLDEDLTSAAVAEEFKRTMHTLKGSARLVGLSAMGDTSHLMESVMEKMPELTGEQVEQAKILLQGGYESLRVMLDTALRQEMPKPAKGVNRVLELFVREGKFEWPPSPDEEKEEAQSHSAPKAETAASDAHAASAPPDRAAESVADVADSVQAPASAMPPPAAAAQPAEHAPAGTAPSALTSSTDSTSTSTIPHAAEAHAADSVAPNALQQPSVEEPSAPESAPEPKKDEDADRSADKAPDVSRFVRVDAQLLDEIIAMVGEASIMRSRMENIAGGVEFSLSELTRISTRIAEQMRRLDNETEAQMLFRREQQGSDDEHFDPLEMDRFTEIQQLSRQLSEAIDDLKNVQDTLANDNTILRNLASQQGIIQRSLQDRLLSTQLMRFDVNEPRLKRLVRQTARTVGKDVQFVLEGGQVELERRLLEDVLPALEHMIRNSIAHGIELPAQRRAAGKPEIGTIKLVVAVQASEVIMRVIDDGQGFDYDRIRSKAREKGYLDEALANDKQYLNSLILRSGFSTAQSLTQISGRGVGMDVVNEMVKQRRGRLGADSLPGKGTEFTIVMPFSMSISEVLLVDIGGRTYAAPMSSITAVSQVSRSDLQDSINSDTPVYHHYDERDYRLYVLGRYFEPGNYEFAPEAAQLPALFVDSGDETAAFHVDRILNRLEIIVKNVNRQVLNIPGISGATILGDASVVPVLELMDLARRIGNIVPTQEVEAAPESTEKRILVVDDSVTMRKVSTRLLERNHFIVETAKDGLDAIDVLQNFKPDLIMLDIEMPRMDGFEFATHVRQNSDVPNVPIVMVTSRTGDKHRERAGQIGVQGYLGKPYREDILMETLNSLLGNGGLS